MRVVTLLASCSSRVINSRSFNGKELRYSSVNFDRSVPDVNESSVNLGLVHLRC